MPKESQPTPLPGVPTPPAYLPAIARKKFRDVARQIDDAGYSSLMDRDLLTQYSMLWYRWRQAEAQIAIEGAVIKNSNDCIQESPWSKVATQCQKDLTRLMNALGLTPAARSKLNLARVESMADEFAQF
jgi:P27 family predicted phage terminase small subunit